MNIKSALVAFFMMLLFITSNGQSINKTVIRNTDFAFDLFKQAFKGDSSICISPYSISFALSMAYAGARNETEAQMSSVLNYDLNQQKNHEAFFEIQRQLNLFKGDTSVKLAMANAIWKRDEEKVYKEYLDLLQKYYSAQVYPITTAKAVNDWVKVKTNNKIQEIITDDILNKAKVVLTNTIYFKGDWLHEFDEKNTRKDTFKIDKLTKSIVDMMYQRNDFNYFQDEYSQVLEMPYKGGELSMLLVMPNSTYTLSDIIKNMNSQTLSDYKMRLEQKKVNVFLPKFNFTSEFELSKELKQMGLTYPFVSSADFSGMAPLGLYISNVIHKTVIEVNENGSEAAAVTAVVLTRSVEPKIIDFNANKPFLFFILDKQTETILFMGSVVNPIEVNGEDVKVYTGPRNMDGSMPSQVGN